MMGRRQSWMRHSEDAGCLMRFLRAQLEQATLLMTVATLLYCTGEAGKSSHMRAHTEAMLLLRGDGDWLQKAVIY
jgi:hypothetical protein